MITLKGMLIDHLVYAYEKGLAELLEAYPELLDAFNEDGWTALQIASYAGQAGAARFLLDRGADLEAVSRNEMANTALHGGVTGWQTDKRAEVVSLLLDRGADTGAGDATGSTPLHQAASAGRPEIVELLLRRGAPVNARRGDGQTPLGGGVREGHTAVAEALRRHGGEE